MVAIIYAYIYLMSEDGASTISSGIYHRKSPESDMIEHNRKIKQMQEKILIREYQNKLAKNNESKHQTQLTKQQELEDINRKR